MKLGRFKSSVGVVCLAISAGPLAAQELPSVEDLRPVFEQALPGYWDVGEFRVVSSAAGGDPVNPLALFRFEADVSPSADLFSETGEEVGPFTVVVPTYSGENVRTIYGTMELAYHAGEWEGGVNLENPVDELGVPLDVFRRPALQSGSPELQSVLSQVRSDTIAKAQADLAAELRALEAEHKAEIDALVATHEAELSAKQRGYEAKLAELATERGPVLATEQAKLDAELEALRTAHAAKVGALKAEQAEMVAELEAGLTARRERLERQLAEAEAVVAAQEATMRAIGVAAANDDALQSAFEARRLDQLAYFQSFGAEMFGSIQCVSDEDPQFKTEFPLYFEVSSVTATGIEGYARSQKGSRNAASMTLALAGATDAGQTELVLSMSWSNVLGTYSVYQDESGSLVGTAKGKMDFDNDRKNVVDGTCRVVVATR